MRGWILNFRLEDKLSKPRHKSKKYENLGRCIGRAVRVISSPGVRSPWYLYSSWQGPSDHELFKKLQNICPKISKSTLWTTNLVRSQLLQLSTLS